MKTKLLKKLTSKGFSHVELVFVIVLAICLGGAYAIVRSDADTVGAGGGGTSTSKPLPDIPFKLSADGKYSANGPKSSGSCTQEYGACYFWSYLEKVDVSGEMTGASVVISVAQPRLDPNDNGAAHSIGELYDSNDGGDAVEIGWIVSKGMFNDDLTHLFIFHWVNGQPTCYNGCGFVSTSTVYKPGMVLKPGTTATLSSQFLINRWEILYNGVRIGYFPESLWGGLFTFPVWADAYGEVASSLSAPMTQMGDGIFAGQTNASTITNLTLIGSTNSSTEWASTAPTAYGNYPLINSSGTFYGISFGGPGFTQNN